LGGLNHDVLLNSTQLALVVAGCARNSSRRKMKRLLSHLPVVIALVIGIGGVGRLATHADVGVPFNGWLSLNGGNARVPYQTEIDFTPANGSFTIEGWIIDSAWGGWVVSRNESFALAFEQDRSTWPLPGYNYYNAIWYTYMSTGEYQGAVHRITSCSPWQSCPPQGWFHFAYVYDQAANSAAFFWNGVRIPNGPIPPYPSTSTADLVLKDAQSMDEFRISNTVRYTSSFTPPTAPFDCDGNTMALWHFDEIAGSTTFHDACGTVDNMGFGYNGAHTEGVTGYQVYLPLVVK
jgi:hypothetical protein